MTGGHLKKTRPVDYLCDPEIRPLIEGPKLAITPGVGPLDVLSEKTSSRCDLQSACLQANLQFVLWRHFH